MDYRAWSLESLPKNRVTATLTWMHVHKYAYSVLHLWYSVRQARREGPGGTHLGRYRCAKCWFDDEMKWRLEM